MRIVILTRDAELLDHERRLYGQLRLTLTNEYGAAVDYAPIGAPWLRTYLEAAPPDAAIIWNGYGPQAVVQAVEWMQQRRIPVIRMEAGWFPQKDHCYLASGLGAESEIAGEISRQTHPVNMDAHRAWAAGMQHSTPDVSGGRYILVCGQVPGDSNLSSLTVPLEEIPRLVRESTERPVLYRPHPKAPQPCEVEGVTNVPCDSPLEQQLWGATAVVAGTSTCLLQAALLGTPAVSLGLGVWTEDMVRHAIRGTLRHVLQNITEGWDDDARDYGLAYLHQHCEVSWRKPKFRSPRIKSLIAGLFHA